MAAKAKTYKVRGFHPWAVALQHDKIMRSVRRWGTERLAALCIALEIEQDELDAIREYCDTKAWIEARNLSVSASDRIYYMLGHRLGLTNDDMDADIYPVCEYVDADRMRQGVWFQVCFDPYTLVESKKWQREMKRVKRLWGLQ